jgi:hypothetical protein
MPADFERLAENDVAVDRLDLESYQRCANTLQQLVEPRALTAFTGIT